MAKYRYDRLSALDNAFLVAETPTTPMHVAAIQIFEAGPLRTEDGGIDLDAVRRGYEAVLHRVPRYRQKIAWIPFQKRAVWIDDPHFRIDYHIRHVALPRPGRIEELKRVASRVMAHHLDRSKPLWEIWIVEGLQGDRFALIAKTHHCMIDGSSGVELAQLLLSPSLQAELPEPRAWVPRPTPSPRELLRDEILDRLGLPLRIARGLRSFRDEVDDLGAELRLRLGVLRDLAGMAVTGASATPINGKLSPHRRFDWFALPFASVRALSKALDCTVNDVVLATVTEAVRRFLVARQVHPEEIIFRASTPVSVRREDQKGQLGNRVSTWILELPIGEPDRRRQLEILRDRTRELKRTRQALGVDMLMGAAELAPSGLLSFGAQLASGPINTVVTNVPGPQFPLHMLGAKMLAMIPQVPLLEGLGLCIALMSYDGQIFWGFTADYELVPDLSAFVECIAESFEELAAVAGVELDAGARSQEGARAVAIPVRPAEQGIQGPSVA